MKHIGKGLYTVLLCGILSLTLLAGCGGGGGGSSDNDNISTTVIGSNGGSATSTDGKFKVEVPAGALASDTTINIAIIEDNIGQVGSLYQVSRDGSEDLVFLKPVTIKVNYEPNLLPEGANEDDLQLGLLGPFDDWEILADSTVDKTNKIISATTTHFSFVGILVNILAGAPPKLSFPLPNRNPFNAAINSVFDQSMTPVHNKSGQVVGLNTYCPDNIVRAYTGEEGTINPSGCIVIKDCNNNGKKTDPEDRICDLGKSGGGTFSVNNQYAYGDKTLLSYDGHPGYDYKTTDTDQNPTNGQIDVLAAADGQIKVPFEKYCWNADGTAKNTAIINGIQKDCFGEVKITHDKVYSTRYLHLSKKIVAHGKTITKGEKIGISGNTGISTGPHLHFEVRKNNVPVDPYAENIWETGFTDLTGTWTGTWSSSNGIDSGNLTANLTQSGTSISGTASAYVTGGSVSCGGPNYSVSGTVSGNNIIFGVFDRGIESGVYTATFTSTSMSGTYSVTAGACAGDTGTFSLNKVS